VTARKSSVVADRLAGYVGRVVEVRRSWAIDGNSDSRVVGTLLAVVPLGCDYFLEQQIDGRKRLVATRAVLS
jgi:hypothetical protein